MAPAGEVPSLALEQGQQAPGTPAGTTFGRITPGTQQVTQAIAAARSGDLAIYGQLSGSQVSITNDTGLWRYTGGSVSLVAREGDAAPDGAPGETLGEIPAGARINAAGHVAFEAPVLGPGGSSALALFSDTAGALNIAARPGDAAPGMAPGTTFQSIAGYVLSDHDTLLFWGQVSSGSTGVWAIMPGQAPVPIAIPGQQLTLGGTPLTIRSLDPLYGPDAVVNANDEVVLRFFTTTNQRAIVVFTIPSPPAATLLLGLGLGFRRRRRQTWQCAD